MNAPKKSRYVRIEDGVYNSVAFRTLPGSALKLWVDLRTQFRGSNNGSLMITMSAQKYRGWNSSDKLVRARNELLERKLIAYTRQCDQNRFRQASLYAFTDLDVAANERFGVSGARASHAYLHWMPAVKPATCAYPKQVQNRTRNRYTTVPETGTRGLETVPETGTREKAPRAAPVLDLSAIRPTKAACT